MLCDNVLKYINDSSITVPDLDLFHSVVVENVEQPEALVNGDEGKGPEGNVVSDDEYPDNNSDLNFIPNTEDEYDSEASSEEAHVTERPEKITKRRRKNEKSRIDEWKKNKNTLKRRQGLAYKNPGKKCKKAREIGAPCSSKFCEKSSKRHCQDVSETERMQLFDKFWIHLKSWPERKLFVSGLVKTIPIKQKKSKGTGSRRFQSWQYSLSIGNKTYRVCKKMFASTLGISQRTLMNWVQADNMVPPEKPLGMITPERVDADQRKRQHSANAIPQEDLDYISKYLASIASVPSHYVRSSYSHLKFLEPGTTIASLYEECKQRAANDGVRVVSYPIFSEIFHAENYSVFIPRKDQCDVCIGAKHGTIPAQDFERHRTLKKRAQEMKAHDKMASANDPQTSVWTMDLQAVLLSPKTDASCMFYKTKLQLHNFTVFCLDTKAGFCYCWDECNGNLSGETFAWLQYQHFKEFLDANRQVKKLIIWSDGCGYQNRNATIANAYFHLSRVTGVTIEQKFLVSGHTQMECDSMHSTIERKIRGPMYQPRDYIVVMQNCRLHPEPYTVKQLEYTDFKDGFQNAYLNTIRPGKKPGDPTVHDLRALRYSKNEIQYKINFDEEFADLPQRIKLTNKVTLTAKFKAKIPIKKRKYNDLQALKTVIPQDLHSFYNNLPYYE